MMNTERTQLGVYAGMITAACLWQRTDRSSDWGWRAELRLPQATFAESKLRR